jgi:hypothetical protein
MVNVSKLLPGLARFPSATQKIPTRAYSHSRQSNGGSSSNVAGVLANLVRSSRQSKCLVHETPDATSRRRGVPGVVHAWHPVQRSAR